MSGWGTVAEIAAAAIAAGIALRVVARTTRASRPEHRRPAGRSDPGPVTSLARAERAALSRRAGDVHARLRPLLVEIAAERLLARGVSLERTPAAARDVLGEPLWELVRPDRPPPEAPFGPELEPAGLAALLDRLEAL